MKIIVMTFLIFYFTPSISAKEYDHNSRWKNLMTLIEQEENAINKITKKSDGLLYRLFELKTEKIKLFKEIDNKNFLSLKMKKRKISRVKAFKKTLNAYTEVKKLGHKILKKYPRTKFRSNIYYTLALNSRDYGYDKKEEQYLQLAIKYHTQNSEILYLAKTALAEYYYNEKKYNHAIKLYKDITLITQDEWYTKNLYNYGWCLLKTKNFHKAISLLEKAYKLSKNQAYINFSEQALNSLVSFYAISNEVEKGKDFIVKNEKNSFPYLFKLVKKVAQKGNFNHTQKLILELEKVSNKDSNLKELKLYQLGFYQKFKRYSLMLQTAKDILVLKISNDQRNKAIELLAHTVGLFQLTIKKDFTRYQNTYDKNKLSRIHSFFTILINLDKKNKAKYEYYLAETYFSIQEYESALFQYRKSFDSYRELKSDLDVSQKSLKAILAVLERTSDKEKYYNMKYFDINNIFEIADQD